MCGMNPLLLREKLWICDIFSNCGSLCQGGVFLRLSLRLSYPPWWGPFIIYFEGIVQRVFRCFSEVIVPYMAVDLVCLWGEESSGSLYVTILVVPSLASLNLILRSEEALGKWILKVKWKLTECVCVCVCIHILLDKSEGVKFHAVILNLWNCHIDFPNRNMKIMLKNQY